MGLLSSLYQQQQQINQNPTSAVRTPIQNAYDNLLNAQANAQNTAKEEWGSAIGNSVNGLAKIIASSVIGNPIEKAASTRNLDNFDARQDALVRQWAMEQAKKRNDFVNQAREQLGMAKADEEQAYNRDLTAQQIAYKQAQDLLEQQNKDRQFDFAKEQAEQAQKNFEKQYNLKLNELNNKPTEMTPEEKLAWELKVEDAKANAKAKREAEQDLNRALAGQQAFQSNLEHIKELSKNSGNILDRSIGNVAGIFTGKDTALTKANNSMDELVSQIRQAALTASGISGESDDKAQQAKLKDIYERAGVPMNAKSLTQAQVSSIINNIENIYRQRIAEKQSFLNSFNNNSVSWE